MVQIGSKASSGSKETFFDHQTPPEQLQYFFSKFEVCNSKWVFGILFQTSSKNAFGRSTKHLTCFSIFIFRSNVTRGAKYGTISNFLSYGFAIQGLVLKKIHFSTSSCEKTFKIKLKLLQKCLKKMQKKSKKIFSSKMSPIHCRWPRVVPKHPPGPRQQFSTILHPQKYFKIFLKSRNFDHQIDFWKVGCPASLKNAFGRSTKNLTCFSIFIFR